MAMLLPKKTYPWSVWVRFHPVSGKSIIIRYTGTSRSWSGIISVPSTSRNSGSRNGKRRRAKA